MGQPGSVRDEVATGYERLKPPVLRRARRWFPTLSDPDLEDAYQSAWLSVVRTDSEVRDVEDYVYAAMRSQGLMELRRRRRRPVARLGESVESAGDDEWADPVDEMAVSPEERAETVVMADWARDLLEELSPRQRSVVVLRWGWGLSRREIGAALGISEKSVKRDLESAGRRLSEIVAELRGGRWCDRRRSVVTAYAFGLLSKTRAARAEAHLRACPGCREFVQELRRRSQDVAAVAPAPLLAGAPVHGTLETLTSASEVLRSHVTEWVSSAKAHALSLSVRATDPTPLAGARPTAVAAAVAGCFAVGSGAYCAVEGAVPEPLRIGPLAQEANASQPKQVREGRRPPAPEPSAPVAVHPNTQVPPPAPEAAPPPTAPPPDPAPAPQPTKDFFGAEPPAEPPASAASTESAEAPTGPAPVTPRGEFGGP